MTGARGGHWQRAALRDGKLVFEAADGIDRALADGFFFVDQPTETDLSAGDRFARGFYLPQRHQIDQTPVIRPRFLRTLTNPRPRPTTLIFTPSDASPVLGLRVHTVAKLGLVEGGFVTTQPEGLTDVGHRFGVFRGTRQAHASRSAPDVTTESWPMA